MHFRVTLKERNFVNVSRANLAYSKQDIALIVAENEALKKENDSQGPR